MPASLLQPCPDFVPTPAEKTADIVHLYRRALAWGVDCKQRHRALAEAVGKAHN